MRWLLRLYPRWWRCRYEDEMLALLEETGVGPRAVADMLLGAIDARLTGPTWRPWRRGWKALGVAAVLTGAALFLASFQAIVVSWIPRLLTPGVAPYAEFLVGWVLITFALLGGYRLVSSRAVKRWTEFAVVPAVDLALRDHVSTLPMPWKAAAALGVAVLVAGASVFILRRARVAWPVALAAGCGFSLLVGLLLGLPFRWGPLPLDNRFAWSFAITLGAALMAWLATRARPRGWGGEPGAGAGVPAKPAPEAPPALTRAS